MSDNCDGGVGDSNDRSGDVDSYSNDYSYNTQTSNYSSYNDYYFIVQTDKNQAATENVNNDFSGIGNNCSALENAIAVVSNVESAKLASDNLNATTRLQIDKSETTIGNNLTTNSIPSDCSISESNNYYESSVGSSNNVTSNINNKNMYNRPRIEISDNNIQSTWFCIIMVMILATFLILLMIAFVVIANMSTLSTSKKTSIYSPAMNRSVTQEAHSPISKI